MCSQLLLNIGGGTLGILIDNNNHIIYYLPLIGLLQNHGVHGQANLCIALL